MGVINTRRTHITESVAIADEGTVSGVLQVNDAASGAVHTGATFVGTGMTFHGATSRGGTYTIIKGTDGNDLSVTIGVSRWTSLPAGVFAFHSIKLIAGTEQTSDQTIAVSLKS